MTDPDSKAVARPEADFAAMADNLPELAWIADASGWIHWYNRRWYDYTGTTPEQMEGWGWQSVHDPEVLPTVLDRWRQSLSTGQAFEMTFPLKGADGVFRPFLTRVRPLSDGAGQVTSWFGVNTDVSNIETTSRELAAQKRVLETLNRTASNVAAELNLERLVQMVTDVTVDLIDAQFGAFFYKVLGENGEDYTLYTISGVPRENFSKFPMPRKTPIFEPTFDGTGIVRSGDITKDSRYGLNAPNKGMPDGHLPVRSYLAAPVISRHGEVMGGLFFGHPDPNVFDEHDEQLVAGLAAQAAIGIDNSRLYEKAQREIDVRKQAEEARLLVMRELNHRVKNLFAVATGMVAMTARTSPSTAAMADTLTGRLRALARAHELIRSTIASSSQEARRTTVRILVENVLAAHVSPGASQFDVRGPDVPIGSAAATSLALVVHELSTNAAKYGALLEPAGKVAMEWRTDGPDMILTWTEHGGPPVPGPPSSKGFGAELARMSVRGQLGGDIFYDWKPEGVVITLRAPLERLGA